jgi:hypothetical protein
VAVQTAISLPASFAVVRHIVPPVGLDTFLGKVGCCSFDAYGQPSGYTVLALDGFKSTSTSTSVSAGATPLSFWANAYQEIAASKAGKGGSSTTSVQKYLIDQLHINGVALLMNALADEAPITEAKANASLVADTIASLVSQNQLDGVNIEFGDFQAVAQGKASSWLQELLSKLRAALPGQSIVLTVPVSMVTKMPLLQQSLVSALVDLFVLKYFGFNT